MPNARWWEFENGKVDLGKIQRPNLNFLSMLLIETALTYSNDWFVVPVKQKAGSLSVIRSLDVIDTFGICNQITPVVDTHQDESVWSIFTLSGSIKGGDESVNQNREQWHIGRFSMVLFAQPNSKFS